MLAVSKKIEAHLLPDGISQLQRTSSKSASRPRANATMAHIPFLA